MIDKNNVANIFPLTPLQEGMLYSEIASGGDAYLMQTSLRIEGELDIEAFHRAWEMLVERHEALRTLVSPDGADRPLQVALKRLAIPLPFTDLSGLEDEEKEKELDRFRTKERETRFELKRPPLFRIALFRTAPARHILVLTFHHIIMDGWCQGILHEELLACFHAVREHRRPNLPPSPPFSRYVRYLSERDTALGLSFWETALTGYEPGGETSWMKNRKTGVKPFDFRVLAFTLSEALVSNLRKQAAECGTTLNAAFQSLWGALICRLSGKRDALWGTVVSGRPPELPGSDRTIGLFINTIPVRFKMDSQATFRTVLTETGRFFGVSMKSQHVPLSDIQQRFGALEGLFDHLVIFENYPVSTSGNERDIPLTIAPDRPLSGHTDYDLVCVADDAREMECRLKYNASAIDERYITMVRDSFLMLADQCAALPDMPLASMKALSADIFDLATRRLAEGAALADDRTTFIDMFRAQVEKTPDRTAVEAKDGVLSYRNLDHVSDLMAQILVKETGVSRGDRVALMTGRDRTLIPAIIGIMKASAVFVPLDPGYPDDRIRFILNDCRCGVVIADGMSLERMKTTADIKIIDAGQAFRDDIHSTNTISDTAPESSDAAYIIYTSGSTGTPKGVIVEHRALANFARGYIASVLDCHETPVRIAFVANYIFDAAGRAFYPSLSRGDTVVVVDEQTRLDGFELMGLLAARSIDILDGTPSLCSLAVESGEVCETIARVVTGGETLTVSAADRIRATFPNAALTNVYGPTETTIDSTFFHVPADFMVDGETIPIGRPLPNQRMYVVDCDLNILPPGASGEIVIGGMGVAKGYLGREELTRERFVADPFRPGEKVYRTGDIGYWRPDDNLQYTGRSDAQVKIRGFRIEIGEIEAVIAREPTVDRCAVIVGNDSETGNSLRAYYVGTVKPCELRARIKRTLPSHMVPDFFCALDRLPLTPTGKIDRAYLSSLSINLPELTTTDSPTLSPEERLIVDAMNRILGRNDLAPEDDFFQSGGHSLTAARLVSVIAARSGKRLPIAALYRFPTPRGLAEFLTRFDPTIAGAMEEFKLRFNNSGPSLFCFPPYGATGSVYQRLGAALEGYRLECFNYRAGIDFIKEAATVILDRPYTEPTTLIGYSGGGNLAFETAVEIERNGGKVRRIVLLDSYRRLEAARVPRSRHEQEMRAIVSSEEYAIFFPDRSTRERAIDNGIAYADYLYSGMEQGIIDAPISLLYAENGIPGTTRDRFGALRSREGWKKLTRGSFEMTAGHGSHDDMLDEVNSSLNGDLIRRIVENDA